jgi:hypothetical protein
MCVGLYDSSNDRRVGSSNRRACRPALPNTREAWSVSRQAMDEDDEEIDDETIYYEVSASRSARRSSPLSIAPSIGATSGPVGFSPPSFLSLLPPEIGVHPDAVLQESVASGSHDSLKSPPRSPFPTPAPAPAPRLVSHCLSTAYSREPLVMDPKWPGAAYKSYD